VLLYPLVAVKAMANLGDELRPFEPHLTTAERQSPAGVIQRVATRR